MLFIRYHMILHRGEFMIIEWGKVTLSLVFCIKYILSWLDSIKRRYFFLRYTFKFIKAFDGETISTIVKRIMMCSHKLRGFENQRCQEVLINFLEWPIISSFFLTLKLFLTFIRCSIFRYTIISVPLLTAFTTFLMWTLGFLAAKETESFLIVFFWARPSKFGCPLRL